MKLFGKRRDLSPQWKLRLYVLLGNLISLAIAWVIVANSDSALAKAPIAVRIGLFALWSIIAYVWLMNRRTSDKTAIKPHWWKS